jgi:hypothetical protein
LLIFSWLVVPHHVLDWEIASAINGERLNEHCVMTFTSDLSPELVNRLEEGYPDYKSDENLDKLRQIPYQTFAHVTITEA